MRDANWTVLTAYIVRLKLCFCEDCHSVLSDYIKQERNFQKSRFPEIPSELESGDSKIHTGWYVGSTQESETQSD
jgi:hypothetical protein